MVDYPLYVATDGRNLNQKPQISPYQAMMILQTILAIITVILLLYLIYKKK